MGYCTDKQHKEIGKDCLKFQSFSVPSSYTNHLTSTSSQMKALIHETGTRTEADAQILQSPVYVSWSIKACSRQKGKSYALLPIRQLRAIEFVVLLIAPPTIIIFSHQTEEALRHVPSWSKALIATHPHSNDILAVRICGWTYSIDALERG